ncbi:zf-HC2 domain-containing protein [Marinobacter salsuginis]|uniref:zf-HC2 domain-containing protein n=1 Tax=Marinobacter salsuginis TaxID=418719 RepID=UPI00273F84F2|nr:zf-HC2 domain-containing protein [Marinobacter salsuginis]
MLMCRDLAVIASDYIDGQLPAFQKMSVKMHLLMCRDCRTFIGNLRASTELMVASSAGKTDEDLIRKIDERVREALANGKSTENGDPE